MTPLASKARASSWWSLTFFCPLVCSLLGWLDWWRLFRIEQFELLIKHNFRVCTRNFHCAIKIASRSFYPQILPNPTNLFSWANPEIPLSAFPKPPRASQSPTTLWKLFHFQSHLIWFRHVLQKLRRHWQLLPRSKKGEAHDKSLRQAKPPQGRHEKYSARQTQFLSALQTYFIFLRLFFPSSHSRWFKMQFKYLMSHLFRATETFSFLTKSPWMLDHSCGWFSFWEKYVCCLRALNININMCVTRFRCELSTKQIFSHY